MFITRKNWQLALLALLGVCFLTSLGIWQLSRAQQKQVLLDSFNVRTQQTPLTVAQLDAKQDLRFYRVEITGYFDNAHTLLLDNKIFHGRVGYEIYTPFHVQKPAMIILVNRGFVPLGVSRDMLPTIKPIKGQTTIIGMFNLPPTYVALGAIHDAISWPLRIQFVNLTTLAPLLKQHLFPYIITLAADQPAAYTVEWQIVAIPPERHLGYAVQWFALALTLLILFLALNRQQNKK